MTGFYELAPEAQSECVAKLARAALAAWDLEARALELLKYRENAVFRVAASDGQVCACARAQGSVQAHRERASRQTSARAPRDRLGTTHSARTRARFAMPRASPNNRCVAPNRGG